jgi:methylated-DNA-[protein]-cysteine S-methyltransferase
MSTTAWYGTPFGVGVVVLHEGLPVSLELPDPARRPAAEATPDDGPWCTLLTRYFGGEPVEFPFDVEAYLEQLGGTAFEADVLRALWRVPYGRMVSYRDLARDAGHPSAWRATGSVMARNELPVILPCHRVTRSDGELGNYGDDPAWKRRLLVLEGALGEGPVRARGRAAPADRGRATGGRS